MPVTGAAIGRKPALLALAVPVLAGLAYQAAFGAPLRYLLMNAAALAGGLALIAFAGSVIAPVLRHRRAAILVLLALFALPLLTGPAIAGVARWLPLPGGFALHSGMLALPLLAALAAEDEQDAPLALLAALLIALLQPDGASAAAVTLAAVGLAKVWRGWQMPLVAAVGLLVTVIATLHGELAPQPFVERVLADAMLAHPLVGLALLAAQLAGFLLIVFGLDHPRPMRLAIGGSLFGFAIMSLMNVYPAPLLGFGAAPIIGYALALAIPRRTSQ